jgi:hypothetical protein
MAASKFLPMFIRLRGILEKHAGSFAVKSNTDDRYGLEAPTGPMTVKMWKGELKHAKIPVAWVEINKSYVSFHLMGVYGNPKLLAGCSKELLAHMQGKSCFNFKSVDEMLFKELEQLTASSLVAMKKAGFVS